MITGGRERKLITPGERGGERERVRDYLPVSRLSLTSLCLPPSLPPSHTLSVLCCLSCPAECQSISHFSPLSLSWFHTNWRQSEHVWNRLLSYIFFMHQNTSMYTETLWPPHIDSTVHEIYSGAAGSCVPIKDGLYKNCTQKYKSTWNHSLNIKLEHPVALQQRPASHEDTSVYHI